ncbi:hypothetical protein ACKWTF_014839 [Chironomus riparius]
MKVVCTLLLIKCLFLVIKCTTSTNIECLYRPDNWTASGDVYVCDNQNNLNITSPETAVVSSSSGIHENHLTNNHVTAYLAYGRNISYFPQSLEFIFKNLRAIYIQNCGLKMIQQSDIKVFPKLVELNLGNNEIEVLSDDLFGHNLIIKYIYLSGNEFIHIGMNVFDSLTELSYLYLIKAKCVNNYVENSTSLVKEVIKVTKNSCFNSDYVEFSAQIIKLQVPLISAYCTYQKQLIKFNQSTLQRIFVLAISN